MRSPKANYSIVRMDDTRIVIRDEGPWTRFSTITNAVEEVLFDLSRRDQLGERRLFYYDSEGHLDEIAHSGDVFVGFRDAAGEDKTW